MTALKSLAEPATFEWALWDYWNQAALLKRREEVTPRIFDRGYRQMAYAEGEKSFPSFEKCLRFNTSVRNLLSDGTWRFYAGIDISSKTRPGTVLVTVGLNQENVRALVEVRYLGDPAQLPDVLQVSYSVWGHETINVENNATQDAILDLWKVGRPKSLKLPLKAFHTGANKAHPEYGLPSLQAEFDNEMWLIPIEAESVDELPDGDHWKRLVTEFTQHPFATTTDGVMSTWFAREAIGVKRGLRLGDQDDLAEPSQWREPGEMPITRGNDSAPTEKTGRRHWNV